MHTRKQVGLVGKPIGQSFSPLIHNFVYERLGLPFEYKLYETERKDLPEMIRRLRTGELAGLNVTIPYKEEILSYVDKVGHYVTIIGAANVLIPEDGGVAAYNTDARAFGLAVEEMMPQSVSGMTAIVHGAGGVARSVSYALLNAGIGRLVLLNRTQERATRVAHDLRIHFPDIELEARDDHPGSVEALARVCDLWVNCVPPGTPLPVEGVEQGWKKPVFIDLDYRHRRPPLLRWAHEHHFRAFNGVTPLVYQALEAIRRWTETDFDIHEMCRAIRLSGISDEVILSDR